MRQFSQEELVEKIRSERRHMNELYDKIQNLEQENSNLKDYVKSLKDECISCPEEKKKIVDNWKKSVRRAQVGILEKLKSKAFQGYQVGMYIVNTQQIDELIEEVENAEDND